MAAEAISYSIHRRAKTRTVAGHQVSGGGSLVSRVMIYLTCPPKGGGGEQVGRREGRREGGGNR